MLITLSIDTSRIDDKINFLTSELKCKRKLTAVCSHQTRIGNLDAHLI
ncbi:Uncharacterised protein [Klebsiella pneumoniae]|nr:Uncharacterised protein [Klebsiella pneumoniae]